MQGWNSFEKFAVGIVVVAVLGVVGWYGAQNITSSSASFITPMGGPQVFVSDIGSDEGNGTVNAPYRTIRKGMERAALLKSTPVTVGLLGEAYSLTPADVATRIEVAGQKEIVLTGFRLGGSGSEVANGLLPYRTVVRQSGLAVGSNLNLFVRAGALTVRGLDFDTTNAFEVSVLPGTKLGMVDNVFTRERTLNGSGAMLLVKSGIDGVAALANNTFYFRGFSSHEDSQNIALVFEALPGSTSTHYIQGNRVYFPWLTEIETIFPFTGMEVWGQGIRVQNNQFAIDAEKYPGPWSMTKASKNNLGISVPASWASDLRNNSFQNFLGTPIVIGAPSASSVTEKQGITIVDNRS